MMSPPLARILGKVSRIVGLDQSKVQVTSLTAASIHPSQVWTLDWSNLANNLSFHAFHVP
jgi:hypothetical protein